MELEFMPCPACREVTLVEIPPCADEHGAGCPDRACTVCGAGLTFAGTPMMDVLIVEARATARTRTAA